MNNQITVAAIAAAAQSASIEENLAILDDAARKAAAAGAELALFPELSATGFIPNHPPRNHTEWLRDALGKAWQTAQPLNGTVVQGLIAISKSAGIFLAAGILENAGNELHNTHVLVGEGKLWGYWRKMHIPVFEMPVYNGGDAVTVAETPLGRIGANVCFDVFLPESTRLLGVQNAEVVLFPFAADPDPLTPRVVRLGAGPLEALRGERRLRGRVQLPWRGGICRRESTLRRRGCDRRPGWIPPYIGGAGDGGTHAGTAKAAGGALAFRIHVSFPPPRTLYDPRPLNTGSKRLRGPPMCQRDAGLSRRTRGLRGADTMAREGIMFHFLRVSALVVSFFIPCLALDLKDAVVLVPAGLSDRSRKRSPCWWRRWPHAHSSNGRWFERFPRQALHWRGPGEERQPSGGGLFDCG